MKNFQFRPFLYDNIYFLPHLVEHIEAIFKSENSLLFLAGWVERTGTNGMGLKITTKDKGGSRTSKEPLSRGRQASASICHKKKISKKNKKKVW